MLLYTAQSAHSRATLRQRLIAADIGFDNLLTPTLKSDNNKISVLYLSK
jgi:hypothetical protein